MSVFQEDVIMPAAATPVRMEAVQPASTSAAQLSLLHVFPSFGIGGVPLRVCRVINYFGKRFRHTIVALDGNFAAAEQLFPGTEFSLMTPTARKGGPLHGTMSAALTIRRL